MIGYIIPGILSGIFAAAVALIVGYGWLPAFAAYVIGGMIGTVTAISRELSPPRPTQPKHPVTQRS